MFAFFVFERTLNSDSQIFLVRRLFIQKCFNVEKSHMSWLSGKLVSVFQTDKLQVLFHIYSENNYNDLYCSKIYNNLFDCCIK